MFKKIISLLLVIAIVFAFACPALADNSSSIVTKWDRLLYNICHDADQGASSSQLPIIKWLLSFGADWVGEAAASLDSNLCQNSDDHFHHGHLSSPIHTLDDKAILCTCDLCGLDFWCYSEDLKQYYSDSVENGFKESLLPAQTVNSDGTFIVTAEHVSTSITVGASSPLVVYCSDSSSSSANPDSNVLFSCVNPYSVSLIPFNSSSVSFRSLVFSFSLLVSVSGFYQRLVSPSIFANVTFLDFPSADKTYSSSYTSSISHYVSGFSISDNVSCNARNNLGANAYYMTPSTFFAKCYPPQYKVTPDTALDITSGDIYNIDNRIGQYIQDFTYNGQTYNQQIVNETTNQYYSPTNNEYFDMNGWSYDYSTQTYNITNNNGDTVTVTYGDEYITINEGDTIYNYYYYITNEAPDDPDDPGTSGLIDWLESFKTWLGEKLDGLGFNVNVTEIVEDMDAPGSDESDDDDASGLLDLVKTIFGGVLKIALKTTDLIIGGVDALSSGIDNFGSFFRLYNPNNPNGVYAYAVPTPTPSPGGA